MKEEVKLLFDNAFKSLEVSKYNIDGGYYNTSINRSYYACFYVAKALLIERGFITKTHSGTISCFGRILVVNENFDSKIAKTLKELFEEREDADYTLKISFSKEDTLEFLNDAKIFVEECMKFSVKLR
ncbi:HEPN domain-containing protein [Methanobrevibacter curvatus]|uniref:HEPN domain protein n=1 Tax=Methanobrevibacter curvatus TaxID=49547 RepID=A0A166C0A1_9EURY|nr:HEPN domain-containing protein [Methanobrevibacter curvatus]KZX10287.1 HEPN domain protein [Methanobrevibacter curvatus]